MKESQSRVLSLVHPAASGAAALIQLCRCVQPMEAGAADHKDTAPRALDGRMGQMLHMSMQCEARRPQPYSMYGGASRAEQGATEGAFAPCGRPPP